MRILVCGSREVNGLTSSSVMTLLVTTLRWFQVDPASVTIVHGAARGADRLADIAAKRLGLAIEAHPADWNTHGKQAGFKRNIEMLETLDPARDIVIGIWDGKSPGTRHTLSWAQSLGLRGFNIRPETLAQS